MHVHLIGICGSGMGTFAGLLRTLGHEVSGSDLKCYPPMSTALERWGITVKQGFSAAHLEPKPDLVVVGNVCRQDNVEARATIEQKLPHYSMPQALNYLLLQKRRNIVAAGTHGKSTTSALVAYLLEALGQDPGYLIGAMPVGAPVNFASGKVGGYFVIEGDEYDSAFFEKQPKFWAYDPEALILTSIEHDHLDIYPTETSYLAAFEGLLERSTKLKNIIAFAGDAQVRRLVSAQKERVEFYALDHDPAADIATWSAALAGCTDERQSFDVFIGGSFVGRASMQLHGALNVRNALAAVAVGASFANLPLRELLQALATFQGLRRRQECIGKREGLVVYDDFAHHPSAVSETLGALRQRHPGHTLIVVFEPRSATACRNLHQHEYPKALAKADHVLLAPLGRKDIHPTEQLNLERLVQDIRALEKKASAAASLEELLENLVQSIKEPATVVFMSNGDFGGLRERYLKRLES